MFTHAAATIQRANSAHQNQQHNGKHSIPSSRNQEIFHRVTVNCEQQSAIAAELGLTRGRISQIIARVRKWLGSGGAACLGFAQHNPAKSPETLSHLERQRLARSLAHAQHQHIYQLTIREFTRQSQSPKHTTIRTESKPTANDVEQTSSSFNPEPQAKGHQNPKSEICNLKSEITKVVSTLRDHSPNIQLLKVAQRSTIEMQKLAELDPIPEPAAAAPSDLELYESLYSVLSNQRQSAEDQGLVPKSHDVFSFVDQLLSALLGQARNIGLPPDAAVRDLLRSFVMGSLPHETYSGENQLLADTLETPTQSASERPLPLEPNNDNSTHPLNTPKPTTADLPLSPAQTPVPATTSAPTPKPITPKKPANFSPNHSRHSAICKLQSAIPPGSVMFAPYSPPLPTTPSLSPLTPGPAPSDPSPLTTHLTHHSLIGRIPRLAGDLANHLGELTVQKMLERGANYFWVISGQGKPQLAEKGNTAVTSEAPQAWYVMLRDEAAAGRVIVPLRPFLKFSRRMDKQLGRLERKVRKAIPQLGRRGKLDGGRHTCQP